MQIIDIEGEVVFTSNGRVYIDNIIAGLEKGGKLIVVNNTEEYRDILSFDMFINKGDNRIVGKLRINNLFYPVIIEGDIQVTESEHNKEVKRAIENYFRKVKDKHSKTEDSDNRVVVE